MILLLAFAAVLLPAVLLSALAHRTILSTAVLFLVAGFLLGDGVTGALHLIPESPGRHPRRVGAVRGAVHRRHAAGLGGPARRVAATRPGAGLGVAADPPFVVVLLAVSAGNDLRPAALAGEVAIGIAIGIATHPPVRRVRAVPATQRGRHRRGWVFVFVALAVARPVALWISFLRSGLGMREQVAAMWFGPKGFASVVYALLVLSSGLPEAETIVALVAVTIVVSIVAHSSTDTIVARSFDDETPSWHGPLRTLRDRACGQPPESREDPPTDASPRATEDA